MSELGKKVSTKVLAKLGQNFESLQTLLIDVICLQDDKLRLTQGKQLRTIAQRLESQASQLLKDKEKPASEQTISKEKKETFIK